MGIYVVGMHRSGTSALSHALGLLVDYEGLKEPQRGNPVGHWENPDLRRELDSMLRSLGSDWSAPPSAPIAWKGDVLPPHKDAIDRIIAGLGNGSWVLKDPRLCVALDAVLAAPQPPATVVNIYRHPVEVASSISARDELPFLFGLALWEAYVRLQLIQGDAAGSVIWVSQDELMNRSELTIGALAAALRGAGLTVAEQSVTAALASIEPGLRHASSGSADPRAALLSDQQQELLELVQRRTEGDFSGAPPGLTPWAGAMIELRRPFSELDRRHRVLSHRMRRVRWLFSSYDWIKGHTRGGTG